MKKRAICAACLLVTSLTAGEALAADTSYLSVKGGMFLPNGKGGGDSNGMKSFDTGFALDLAAGYRPAPYAALEVGTGFYSASGKDTFAVGVNNTRTVDRTAYGVPITLTAKGVLEFEKIVLSAGAGVGYYFGFISSDITNSDPAISPTSESSHGGALGYQAVLDADFKVGEHWTIGAAFKWFSTRPELELTDPTTLTKTKTKWEMGGSTISLGAKYSF